MTYQGQPFRPGRDPYSWEGVERRPERPPALPDPQMVTHEHVCPDGTPVQARSQWIPTTASTLDRWVVGGLVIATSARPEVNTVPPDFTWLDQATAARQPWPDDPWTRAAFDVAFEPG
jgi:hypothetical protein